MRLNIQEWLIRSGIMLPVHLFSILEFPHHAILQDPVILVPGGSCCGEMVHHFVAILVKLDLIYHPECILVAIKEAKIVKVVFLTLIVHCCFEHLIIRLLALYLHIIHV